MFDTLLFESMDAKTARMKNPLVLAYLGDTVWDLLVRQELVKTGEKVNTLHRKAISRVNAGAQAEAVKKILSHFTEEELDIFHRGCNAHTKHNTPENQDPVDYSMATGLESVLGFLYLIGNNQRIFYLFSQAEDQNV